MFTMVVDRSDAAADKGFSKRGEFVILRQERLDLISNAELSRLWASLRLNVRKFGMGKCSYKSIVALAMEYESAKGSNGTHASCCPA